MALPFAVTQPFGVQAPRLHGARRVRAPQGGGRRSQQSRSLRAADPAAASRAAAAAHGARGGEQSPRAARGGGEDAVQASSESGAPAHNLSQSSAYALPHNSTTLSTPSPLAPLPPLPSPFTSARARRTHEEMPSTISTQSPLSLPSTPLHLPLHHTPVLARARRAQEETRAQEARAGADAEESQRDVRGHGAGVRSIVSYNL